MAFETTSARLWKHLSRDERLAAATAFWHEPPQEMLGTALAAIVKARRLRPQVARSMPEEERARALAAILDPGEVLASSLFVSLHLAHRRPLLGAFLDAIGLPHEDGLLKEDPAQPPSEETLGKGVQALLARFERPHVALYLNALWLQDPDRWGALDRVWASVDGATQRA